MEVPLVASKENAAVDKDAMTLRLGSVNAHLLKATGGFVRHASQTIQDAKDCRASLEKIEPLLGPIMVVYPKHGKSFPGRRLSRITA